jgi:hypothetical protein
MYSIIKKRDVLQHIYLFKLQEAYVLRTPI